MGVMTTSTPCCLMSSSPLALMQTMTLLSRCCPWTRRDLALGHDHCCWDGGGGREDAGSSPPPVHHCRQRCCHCPEPHSLRGCTHRQQLGSDSIQACDNNNDDDNRNDERNAIVKEEEEGGLTTTPPPVDINDSIGNR